MPVRIVSIGTALPTTSVTQRDLRDFFAAQSGADKLTRRLISGVFDASGIETRHTVLSALRRSSRAEDPATPADSPEQEDPPSPNSSPTPAGSPEGAFVSDEGALLSPTTGVRNDLYRQAAPRLAAQAAQQALHEGELSPDAVTHLITVSCTGFFAPGLDYRLVRDLGLPETVERSHLGFMGCAAALPGLRLASQIGEARPDAVVLVVCVELCSLHVRDTSDAEQIVAASVFADGAAAALITGDGPSTAGDRGPRSSGPAAHPGGMELERFTTALTSEGESDMAWTIEDHGFRMTLTAEVPRIIGREIRGAVSQLLDGDRAPKTWAVHPGGRSVLDRVEAGLELQPQALAASRQVLREAGNMSSATILFILRRLLHDPAVQGRIAALAFGPGLTVESALLRKRS